MYHIPVLLHESIKGLNIKPDGIYVDVTFGGGGHSRQILKKLKTGRLIAFDQDKDARKNSIEDERFTFVHGNFQFISNYLRYLKIKKVDGILADLGVSSHHFDTPERGFSFRFDAELDMRMNQNANVKASDILNNYKADELQRIFTVYGEIKNPVFLTNKIISYRSENEFKENKDIFKIIPEKFLKSNKNQYLAKIFQALRIEVNKELDCLKEFLIQTTDLLNNKGRLVIISYHSLEDRLVKNFMKTGNLEGKIEKDFYGNFEKPFKVLTKRIITPTDNEIKNNNRARSAKLRIAEK